MDLVSGMSDLLDSNFGGAFGGAIDIVVVRQRDDEVRSSPFYVRFGNFSGALPKKEKVVTVLLNGIDIGFKMRLSNSGEAYFLPEDYGKAFTPTPTANDGEGRTIIVETRNDENVRIDAENDAETLEHTSTMPKLENSALALKELGQNPPDSHSQNPQKNHRISSAPGLGEGIIRAPESSPLEDNISAWTEMSSSGSYMTSLEAACEERESMSVLSTDGDATELENDKDNETLTGLPEMSLNEEFTDDDSFQIALSTPRKGLQTEETATKEMESSDCEYSKHPSESSGDEADDENETALGDVKMKGSPSAVEPEYQEKRPSSDKSTTEHFSEAPIESNPRKVAGINLPSNFIFLSKLLGGDEGLEVVFELSACADTLSNVVQLQSLKESQEKDSSPSSTQAFENSDTLLKESARLLKSDFEANRVTLAITSSFLECSGAKLVLRLEERKYYFWSQVSSAIVATAIFSEIPRELVPVFVEDNFPRPDIPITQKYRISVDQSFSRSDNEEKSISTKTKGRSRRRGGSSWTMWPFQRGGQDEEKMSIKDLTGTGTAESVKASKDRKSQANRRRSSVALNNNGGVPDISPPHENSKTNMDISKSMDDSVLRKSTVGLSSPLHVTTKESIGAFQANSRSNSFGSTASPIVGSPPTRKDYRSSHITTHKRKSKRSYWPPNDLLGEHIRKHKLEEGCNVIEFVAESSVYGKQVVRGHLYLWNWNSRIVISDVDGTITRSDVLGHVLPRIGFDWTQPGVVALLNAIKSNRYQVMYLSARALAQSEGTRVFLSSLRQNGIPLPNGPIFLSPDGLLPAFYREVIQRKPEEFKIACLEDIKFLFPEDWNPFYAGFGNRHSDQLAYHTIGIDDSRIFTINPKGVVTVHSGHGLIFSYERLTEIVNEVFPVLDSQSSDIQSRENYSSHNFWRMPLPEIDV